VNVAQAAIAGAALAAAVVLPALTKRAADAAALDPAGDGSTAWDAVNPWGAIERQLETYRTNEAMAETNVRAFLATIAAAEGTDPNRYGIEPYRVCYGYRHTIRDLAEHPAVSGEWAGEPLDALGPRYAGLRSTAAGKFQIIRPTWLRVKRALGLPDFGPASQDAAAVYLIRQRGALDAIERGDFAGALALCAAEWASLPGSTAGQPTRKLDQLAQVFTANGGAIA